MSTPKAKEQLDRFYTENEQRAISDFVEMSGGINMKMLARNRHDGILLLEGLAKKNADDVVKAIVTPGSSRNVRYLMQMSRMKNAAGEPLVSLDLIEQIKTQVLSGQIKNQEFLYRKSAFGIYEPLQSYRYYQSHEKTLRELFKGDSRWDGVQKMMALSRNAAKLEEVVSNPSKTGQAVIGAHTLFTVFRGLYYTLGAAATGYEAKEGHPKIAAAIATTLVMPRYAAKLYLNPNFVKWATIGAKTPVSSPQAWKIATQVSIAAMNAGFHITPEQIMENAVKDPREEQQTAPAQEAAQ
jgi:hypothetical protein